jgi:hypothetical protein
MRLLALLGLLLLASSGADAEPMHYRLAATVIPEPGMTAVDVTITLPSVAAGETSTFVLGREFAIVHAESEHSAAPLVRQTNKPWSGLQEVSFTFLRAVEGPQVRLIYHGRPSPGGEPPINQIAPQLVELSLDGMWLPILASLDGRFTVDAILSGLAPDAVVAAQGQVERRNGRVFVRREVPDLDFAFAASRHFRVTESPAFTLYAADPGSAMARLYLDHGARSRAWLSGWLGDIGQDRVALAIISRPRTSGYARKQFIVTTDQGEAPNPAPRAKFIAHELAHLWLSNANATTTDRWLDESTAEYAGLRYVEDAFGKEERDRLLEPKRAEAAKAPPLLGGAPTGAGLYSKGPLLLFELETRIGREAMDRLIGEVARRRIGRTPDFLAALARLTTPADAGWFEAKLRQ